MEQTSEQRSAALRGDLILYISRNDVDSALLCVDKLYDLHSELYDSLVKQKRDILNGVENLEKDNLFTKIKLQCAQIMTVIIEYKQKLLNNYSEISQGLQHLKTLNLKIADLDDEKNET